METGNFKLMFEGKIAKDRTVEEVKKNLRSLLKLDAKSVERFFSGKPIVIKKGLDQKTALKYKKALEKAGALCKIDNSDADDPQENPNLSEDISPVLPQDDLPDQTRIMTCPKCNHVQAETDICIKCGTDVKKYIESMETKTYHINQTFDSTEMILTNIECVPGKKIVEHYGLVSGSTIRAKHIGKDFMAGLKNLVGGELTGYTQLLQESREEAINRMKEQARQLGGNAIINIRFSTSSVAQGAAELYAYGTAVKVI